MDANQLKSVESAIHAAKDEAIRNLPDCELRNQIEEQLNLASRLLCDEFIKLGFGDEISWLLWGTGL